MKHRAINTKKPGKSMKNSKNKTSKKGDTERKESKSSKFWKLQTEKANQKKKIEQEEEFEVVGQEWDSENEQTVQNSEEIDIVDDAAESQQDEQDSEDELDEKEEYTKQIQAFNRKGKKSGGFQSMGLSYPVYKAIMNLGYKIPTPIQRKAIPVILQGKDVVAMARTGSGKTAAFLIPMIEKLKQHSVKVGFRALVLSPSRELATQTLKFVRDFSKNTDLRSCVFVGGDNMEEQFAAVASNPDIIIATPGRLMHLIIEMKLELKTVEYVVFDEADRLFEMGFAEQLREITLCLPPSRQTLLFSATLPKLLVEFARAGLENPALIRLDVDAKISRDLQMYFFSVQQENKEAALLYLLHQFIPKEQQTVVFVSTKHHVEYVNEILRVNGFSSTYIYGSLDQSARKINLARFRYGKVKILVVTDVAARGIDVPLLDNVINYDFPPSSKIFVHRVGRTARAGKSGSAWSLVSHDELPYMLDLQLFTGRPLIFASSIKDETPIFTSELIFGTLPFSMLALEHESFHSSMKTHSSLEPLRTASQNAYKMFLKSRPTATKVAYTRTKEIAQLNIGLHPLFKNVVNENEISRENMVASISQFRPQETIFEIGKKGLKSSEAVLMQKRRKMLSLKIAENQTKRAEFIEKELQSQEASLKKRPEEVGKSEYFLNYRPSDADTEQGYKINGQEFAQDALQASMDMVADDPEDILKQNRALVWDSKKHRFTRDTVGSDNKKRIKTDQGTTVVASFKSDRYERWKKQTKIDMPRVGDQEISNFVYQEKKYRHNNTYAPNIQSKSFARKLASKEKEWRKEGKSANEIKDAKKALMDSLKSNQSQNKNELKTAAQIAKQRRLKDQRRLKTGRHGLSKKRK